MESKGFGIRPVRTLLCVYEKDAMLLRSRYENATPNLCCVFCALLGVL